MESSEGEVMARREHFFAFLLFSSGSQKGPFWVHIWTQIGSQMDQNMIPDMDHNMGANLDPIGF